MALDHQSEIIKKGPVERFKEDANTFMVSCFGDKERGDSGYHGLPKG